MKQVVMPSIVQMDTETLKKIDYRSKGNTRYRNRNACTKETFYSRRSLENSPG